MKRIWEATYLVKREAYLDRSMPKACDDPMIG